MTTPYKYCHQVWIPTNPNMRSAEWEIDDYIGRREFYSTANLAIFASELAPKISGVPSLRKEPVDREINCKEL